MRDNGTLLALGAVGIIAALRRGPVSTLAATTRLAVSEGVEDVLLAGSVARRPLGDCYRTAGSYALSHPEVTLAHGRPRGLKSGHAWVEYEEVVPVRDETIRVRMVYDPEHDLRVPADVYYKLGHIDARGIRRYPHDELAATLVRERHWGPWPSRRGTRAVVPPRASNPRPETTDAYLHALGVLRWPAVAVACRPTAEASAALVAAWVALPQVQKEALEREVRWLWSESANILRAPERASALVLWLPGAHRPPGIPRIGRTPHRDLGGRMLSLDRWSEMAEPWRVRVDDVMLDSRMEDSPLRCMQRGDERVIVLKPGARPTPAPEAYRHGR
jgi:hypothetical protein